MHVTGAPAGPRCQLWVTTADDKGTGRRLDHWHLVPERTRREEPRRWVNGAAAASAVACAIGITVGASTKADALQRSMPLTWGLGQKSG